MLGLLPGAISDIFSGCSLTCSGAGSITLNGEVVEESFVAESYDPEIVLLILVGVPTLVLAARSAKVPCFQSSFPGALLTN